MFNMIWGVSLKLTASKRSRHPNANWDVPARFPHKSWEHWRPLYKNAFKPSRRIQGPQPS